MRVLKQVLVESGLDELVTNNSINSNHLGELNAGFEKYFNNQDSNGWRFQRLTVKGVIDIDQYFFTAYGTDSEKSFIQIEEFELKFNEISLNFSKQCKNDAVVGYIIKFRDLWFPVDISQKFIRENYKLMNYYSPGVHQLIGKGEKDYTFYNMKANGSEIIMWIHKNLTFTDLLLKTNITNKEFNHNFI